MVGNFDNRWDVLATVDGQRILMNKGTEFSDSPRFAYTSSKVGGIVQFLEHTDIDNSRYAILGKTGGVVNLLLVLPPAATRLSTTCWWCNTSTGCLTEVPSWEGLGCCGFVWDEPDTKGEVLERTKPANPGAFASSSMSVKRDSSYAIIDGEFTRLLGPVRAKLANEIIEMENNEMETKEKLFMYAIMPKQAEDAKPEGLNFAPPIKTVLAVDETDARMRVAKEDVAYEPGNCEVIVRPF